MENTACRYLISYREIEISSWLKIDWKKKEKKSDETCEWKSEERLIIIVVVRIQPNLEFSAP